MTMRFVYQHVAVAQPVLSLGGRWGRPKPIIRVTLIGPRDSRLREGLLDTGADDTVFSEMLAPQLGIDLTHAPVRIYSSVGQSVIAVRFAQVFLRITDGAEMREWEAW